MRWYHLMTGVVCLGLLAAVGPLCAGEPQARQSFQIGGGFSFGRTNSQGMSYGHAYLVSGEPGFVFGGVQDRDGKWKLNYLVMIKHSATATSTFHLGSPDPTRSSEQSDGKIRLVEFNERIRFDQTSVTWSYKARLDAVKDALISEEMAFQGKQLDLADGRAFVVDMTIEPVTIQQVNVKLPSSEINVLRSEVAQYKTFTSRWLAEVAKDSEVVKETFGQ